MVVINQKCINWWVYEKKNEFLCKKNSKQRDNKIGLWYWCWLLRISEET